MAYNLENHPCFNKDSCHTHGRIHLPVAPKCNIQCMYCDRKNDCVNESRPGVTSAVLTPGQALMYLDEAVRLEPRISVVGIAGPGDPFANPEETMDTLRRVRAAYPDMLLCVASNGLGIAPYIPELAELGVTHITLTINAVDPEIASKMYRWVRDGKKIYRGDDAGAHMLEKQLEAARLIKEHDILLKVNVIVTEGINDEHLIEVAKVMKEIGADILNPMALVPVAGTPFEHESAPSPERMAALSLEAGLHLPQMTHCQRCRADAVGLIGEGISEQMRCCLTRAAGAPVEPAEDRPCIAVASREGMLVNQHLGEAKVFYIYEPGENGYVLKGTRSAPAEGTPKRWDMLADELVDCRLVLCSGVGTPPRETLWKHGIAVTEMEGLIAEGLDAIMHGRPVKAPTRKMQCGVGCSGDGGGCG